MKKISGLFFIFITLVLFSNKYLGFELGENKFILKNRQELFLLNLAFLSVIFYSIAISLVKNIKENYYKKKNIRDVEDRLKKLTTPEKYILSLYINEKMAERPLDPADPAVAWLESIKILANTGKISEGNKKIFKIAPFAMRVLNENPNWLYR